MGARQRFLLLGLVDTIIIACAITLAYLLRFDFQIRMPYFKLVPYVILMHVGILLPAFYKAKLYRRVWQYASVGELISIVKAVTVSELLFYAIHLTLQMIEPTLVVPRSVYILSWAFIVLGVGGSRFAWRMFRDSYLKIQPHHKRTMIIGAGDAGAMIAKELKHSPDTDCYPVVFIDDDPSKKLLEVMGLPIVGSRHDIPEVVKRFKIQEIIIALPSASRSEIADVLNICKKTRANIKILPRVADLVNGKVSLKMIRDVKIEDLLGREPVRVDLNHIVNYVKDKVVMVTGAGGSIGSELCRQIASFSPEKLLLLGHGENSIYDIELELLRNYPDIKLEPIIADIQDRHRIESIFARYKPAVVFHAAAHKHVPLMERNPSEAIKNNVLGTKNVAECAHIYGASHFVLISTDKAVNPTSVMGTTKRIAEMIVQSLDKESNTKFVAVRFGNVLGSRGSVIPVFKQQIEHGGPVTVTHPDMVRYFMTIPEAVQLVIQAGALAKGGEIFILDMGEPVKIDDLARDLIRLSGLEPDEDIKIIYTGIRPGEKLFEEILADEEGTEATRHDRIFVGKPLDFSRDELFFMLRMLEQTISKETIESANQIRQILRQIVPTYQWKPEKTGSAVGTSKLEAMAASREFAAGTEK
ncbi:polysaccharide biosynthesis protein [Effusibacillus lacus]|uniref:Polysaccharide biosynthesis protein CapD n=1 Tax=Effusibacillus lacus TaxID=1348429 RepID=A0A292YEV7_9BACL|nr:nucleoside-diphosphate sugar epimerase/dehydratase [Effusibacillus lacus]TCS73735.1 FlaA1/EpsC-like NDP-sugar epimerase [Effusibacillus lacus]GAX92052.1 polysaccharide biosynthesis protein CapD [Effusibacillus lacus]